MKEQVKCSRPVIHDVQTFGPGLALLWTNIWTSDCTTPSLSDYCLAEPQRGNLWAWRLRKPHFIGLQIKNACSRENCPFLQLFLKTKTHRYTRSLSCGDKRGGEARTNLKKTYMQRITLNSFWRRLQTWFADFFCNKLQLFVNKLFCH